SEGGAQLFAAAVLAVNSLLMLYPVLVMVLSGFKSTGDLFQSSLTLPDFGNIDNFRRIFTETRFPAYLLNSVIVTGGSIAAILVLGTMGAYALARYEFRGNTLLLLLFLAGMMLPLKLAVIPLFLQLRDFG